MYRVKTFCLSIIVLLLTSISYGQVNSTLTNIQPGSLGKWVNPFIGTGGYPWMCGFNTPAATTPFGMIRLGPDTSLSYVKAINTSGYYYEDPSILGFSHTRLVGTGAVDGGHFLIVPTVGPVKQDTRQHGQLADFSHDKETAFPGYYAVELTKLGILAELTATPRVGVHRYTFPANKKPHILIDITNTLAKGQSSEVEIRILPENNEVEGCSRIFGSFSGRFNGIKAYFVARFSQPFASYGIWKDDQFFAKKASLEEPKKGHKIGADLDFATQNSKRQIVIQVAISYVSLANARANLEAEARGATFDETYYKARDLWENTLGSVKVKQGSKKQRICFYTALYNSHIMPTVFNDVNGDYLGFDRQIHNASGFNYYTDLSLWDTFRTLHPLLILVAPKQQRDMVVSVVDMAKRGGWLPRWPSGNGYTNSMFGTPADVMIAGSYLKGIRDFDIMSVYRSMRGTATKSTPKNSPFSGREGVSHYLHFQYCPAELMDEAIARNLEFCYSDHAISLLAKELGFTKDAELFAKRAQFYRNIWNPQTQYFQPRDSKGNFVEPFYPLLLTYLDPDGSYTNDFVEGSALHWRWAVPHDPKGLISLFKSREYFVEELNTFFLKTDDKTGSMVPSSYYWHGNEHDIHSVYLFNSADRPDLTQKWVRWILEHKYQTTPGGLDGNDDGGTLSAWYVFSALGFYPVAGTEKYELGSPAFKEARIQLGDKVLNIIAENNSPQNVYVKEVWLNGVLLNRTWIKHSEIAKGGELRFKMSAKPN